MPLDDLVSLAQQGLLLALVVSLPVLGVAAVIGEENMYPTLPTAVDEYHRQYSN